MKNPLVAFTNFLLLGIVSGGALAWLISSLIERTEQPYSSFYQEGVFDDLEFPVSRGFEEVALNDSSTDTDADGIPDQWELEHFLNPGFAGDALSDFDNDGLTALHEYQLGSNPLGNWTEDPLSFGDSLILDHQSYKTYTSSGFILVDGVARQQNFTGERSAVLWHAETGHVEIDFPQGAMIRVWDASDGGIVVGGFVPAGGGDLRPFKWSVEEGFIELTPPSSMSGSIFAHRINEWGQILYQASSSSPVVSAVTGPLGDVVSVLESGILEPRLVCLNNFGEVLGVYRSPADGMPKAFLRLPGLSDFHTSLAASYPGLFEDGTTADHFSAKMNDYGEFASNFTLNASNPLENNDFYFFDGDYHSFKNGGDGEVQLVDLNNQSQILFSAEVPDGTSNSNDSEYRLSSEGHIVALSMIHEEDSDQIGPRYKLLSDQGVIIGYRQVGPSNQHEPFILRKVQDADGDGLSDDWEGFYGFDPNSPLDAHEDADGDGYSNLAEFRLSRNPNVEEVPSEQTGNMPDLRPGIDTDGDGMPNVWEIEYGFNWEDPSDAILDLDRDGYSNLEEFLLGTTPAGAPVFEPVVVESESGGSLSGLFFGPKDEILGRGISDENKWIGFEWKADGESQWYHPADSGGSSQILAANSQFAGGYETIAGDSKKIASLWSRSGGSLEPVVNFSGVQFKDSKVVKLAPNGASGVIAFTREESAYETELALLIDHEIHSVLTIQDSGGVEATSVIESSIVMHGSGGGAACAKFPGNEYKVIHWGGLKTPQVTVFETGRYSPFPVCSAAGSSIFAWPTGGSSGAAISILEDGVVTSVSETDVTRYDLMSVTDHGLILGVAVVNIDNQLKSKPFSLRKGGDDQWGFHYFKTEPESSYSGVKANRHSEVAGKTYEFGQNQFSFWRGTEIKFDLPDLVSNSESLELISIEKIGSLGSILCRINEDLQGRYCVMVPVSDTDGDGATDQWEVAQNLDPFNPSDGADDPDGDGLVNSDEFRNQTDPRVADSDQDTMKDGWEVKWGFDPLVASDAYADPDRDQVQNRFEHALSTSPTGIYRFETANVPELDAGYSPQLQARFSSQSPFTVVRAKLNGVVGTFIVDDGGIYEEVPPLAPGKAVYIKEVGSSGTLYGHAYDENNKNRFVTFSRGDLNLRSVDIPTSSANPYVFPIDVSQDERSVLVRRRTPEGVMSTDVLSVAPSTTLASEDALVSVSFSDAGQTPEVDGLYPYFYPSICDGPTNVIGVLSFYHLDDSNEELVIGVEAGRDGFDQLLDLRAHIEPVSEDWSEVDGWGGILRPSDPDDHFNYTWDGWSSVSGRFYRELISDTYSGGETKLFQTRGHGYSYLRDANSSGLAVVESAGRHYLSSLSHCLEMDRLRVKGINGSESIPEELPRVGDFIPTGSLGARFINKDGQVTGLARYEEEALFWTLTEANDFDDNGMDDDFERFRQVLGGAYLEANSGSSLDDQAFLDLISVSTSQQISESEAGGGGLSDRDGDGIEDHLDAHPDDRRIDWEKGKRPSFAVVELEDTEQFLTTGVLKVDFSSSGVVLLKNSNVDDTRVFPSGGDSHIIATDGELLDHSIPDAWITIANQDGNAGISVDSYRTGSFFTPAVWQSSSTSQNAIFYESNNLEAVGGVEGLTAFHKMARTGSSRTGSLLTVRANAVAGGDALSEWVSIEVSLSGGDNENLMSGWEKAVYPASSHVDQRTLVSKDGLSWDVLPKPTHAMLGIAAGFQNDFIIAARERDLPAVGSPVQSSGLLGLPQLVTSSFNIDGIGDLPDWTVHAVYNVGNDSDTGGAYSIKDVVPDFWPLREYDHTNHVGICRVVGNDGNHVDRSLWVAGSTLYTKKGAGSFRETELGFATVGDVRGISTQGWIATTGGLFGTPQILYADPDPNESPWQPLQSFVRDEEDLNGTVTKEYSVKEVYELERNGLILARVSVVEGDDNYETLAILTPVETDSEDSSEAISTPELVVPDRYRSISLDGRPKHEGAPQGEAEEDLPAERGNIDVHTRQLKYDTSHAYLQVPASDLALQVTQVHSPSPIPIPPWSESEKAAFLLADGSIDLQERSRRREAQMGRSIGPFGVNWSSNLTATVKLTPELKNTAPGEPQEFSHYSVRLTDEAGRTHEFQSVEDDLSTFYVKSSQFVDAKSYAMSLKRVMPDDSDPTGSYLLLEKKYGTTLRYDWLGEVPPLDFPSLEGGGFASIPPVYQARLTRVSDRFDSEAPGSAPSALIYEYPPGDTPSSSSATIPSRIYVEGREALAINIVTESLASAPGHHPFSLIQGVTDPRGNTTTFSYKWSNVGGAQIPVIHKVRKSDGGESVFEYYPPRVASPIAKGQEVNLLLENTDLEGFDDLRYLAGNDQGGDEVEIEFSDEKILEAKCHVNLRSITNAVGETYTFEYEGDGRYDSVIAEYSASAKVNPALRTHALASKPAVDQLLLKLEKDIKDSVEDSYEERFTRDGGVLLSSTEEDGITKMIFGVPNVGGPDRIKRVILPPDPSLPESEQASVVLDQFSPTLTPPVEGSGPPSNQDEVTSLPVRWFSQREQDLPAGYHVKVIDAEGSQTEYRFEGVIYGASSSDLDRSFGGVSSQPDTKVLAASALAYTTIAITSVIDDTNRQMVRYNLNPLAGFALSTSTDLNGHQITYEYGDTMGGGAGASKTAYHFISDYLSFEDQPLDESREAGVRYSDPTKETYRRLLSGNPHTGIGATYEDLRTRTYAYSDHYRIMKEATDFRGSTTIWTVSENGNRTDEKVYAPRGKNDPIGALGELLKETHFEYTSQFPGFLTRNIVKADPEPETADWEVDLITESVPNPMGWVGSTKQNPGDSEIVTSSTYDEVGNKISSTDARRNVITFEYDDVGRLITTRYPGPENATKEIFYNKASRIFRSRNENGVDTLYEYDHRGRRVTTGLDLNGNRLLDQGDIITRKVFNNVNRVVEVTDPNGNRSVNEYDVLHRLVTTSTDYDDASDDFRIKSKLFYSDEFGSIPGSGLLNGSGYSPSRSLDPRGFISEVELDSLYRVTASRKEYQKPTTIAGDWTERTLGLFALSRSEFDDNGNTTKTTVYRAPDGGEAAGFLESLTQYDGLNRPVLATVAPGTDLETKTSTAYTFSGLAWKSVTYDGLPGLERHTETEYDPFGRPTKVWSPDPSTGLVNKVPNASPLLGSPCVETVYDANGNVTATIDPLGRESTFFYDARNRQWKVENPLVYDDEAGMHRRPTVTSIFDPVGNVITTIDPRGIISNISYDRANRAYHTVSAFGLPEQAETYTEYDSNGNVVAVTDPNGHLTVNHYDSLSRLIATVVNPDTGNPSRSFPPSDPGDIVVGNQYDQMGNLVRVADGMADKIWNGNLWSGPHVTGFTFDGFGRQTERIWDIGTIGAKVEETSYDALLATHSLDPKGQKKAYVYDGLHRMTEVNHPAHDGSDGKPATAAAPLEDLKYSFQNQSNTAGDGPGPLLSVTHKLTSPSQLGGATRADVSYTLDFLGRQITETSAGVTHSHLYDRAGNRRMTSCDASDRKLLSFYDSHNRLTTCVETDQAVTDPLDEVGQTGARLTRYYYNASGAVVRKELPVLYVYKQFDGLGRTKNSYSYSSAWELAAGLEYTRPGGASGYDAAGNLCYVRETYSDLSTRIIENSYDATNRLRLERDTRGGVIKDSTYQYDKANNRTAKLVDDASSPGGETKVTYTYGDPSASSSLNSNQLISYTHPLDPSVTEPADIEINWLSYDKNGNLTSKLLPSESFASIGYSYDRSDRLVAVTGHGGLDEAYRYDYRTRRIARSEASKGQSIVTFSGGTSAAEWQDGALPDIGPSRTTVPSVEYIRGSDWGGGVGGILYTIPEVGRVSYNAYNSRGDVVARVGESETGDFLDSEVTWQGAYEAYGKRVEEFGETDLRQMANTKEEDPTGLLNEGFRYRDLETGIWLTRDPAGFVDGPNVYTYVRQNPWTNFDAYGLEITRKDALGIQEEINSATRVYNLAKKGFDRLEEKGFWGRSTMDTRDMHAFESGMAKSAQRIAMATAGLNFYLEADVNGDGLVTDEEEAPLLLRDYNLATYGNVWGVNDGPIQDVSLELSGVGSMAKFSLAVTGAVLKRAAIRFAATKGGANAANLLAKNAPKKRLFPNLNPVTRPVGKRLKDLSGPRTNKFTGKGNDALDFVVDEAGQLHLGKSHAYLSGGNPVQAAGRAHFDGGKLIKLDNGSGHYLPSGVKPSVVENAFGAAGYKSKGLYSEPFKKK